MHLKNGRSSGNGAYAQKGTALRVMVANSPKFSFYQMAVSVPEIMDGSLYFTRWRNLEESSDCTEHVTKMTSTISDMYSASHLRVALENVGLQKEQKYNTFACHTCNEVWLCVLWIRKKEVGNTKS
jgi:hypothetical protein